MLPIDDLKVPEGVLDSLPSDAHGVGHPVEPGLHRVEDTLTFSALEPLQLVARATGLRGQVKQAVRWRRRAAPLTAQNRRQIIFK